MRPEPSKTCAVNSFAVVLDEPQGGARDGGQVSAPAFKEIAEAILPELNVAPDANIRQEILREEDIPKEIETIAGSKKPTENETKIKQKTEAVTTEKPKSETKNKSSGTKNKT